MFMRLLLGAEAGKVFNSSKHSTTHYIPGGAAMRGATPMCLVIFYYHFYHLLIQSMH